MKKLKNTCNTGETGEAAFLLACLSHGFVANKPFGHGQAYDFIVDVNGTLLRVQIKTSSWTKTKNKNLLKFNLNARRNSIEKTTSKYDILVGYDLTHKDFYIIPAKKIYVKTISFSSATKQYVFKNNWAPFSSK